MDIYEAEGEYSALVEKIEFSEVTSADGDVIAFLKNTTLYAIPSVLYLAAITLSLHRKISHRRESKAENVAEVKSCILFEE